MHAVIHSSLSDRLTSTEVFAEFGFRPSQLKKLRVRCLALGKRKRIRHWPASRDCHGRITAYRYSRKDLERIRSARANTPGPRHTDAAGKVWVNRNIACGDPYNFSFQRLTRWSEEGCPFLQDGRKLTAIRLVTYKRRGFQEVWYFLESELAEILSRVAAGRMAVEPQGPGCTQEEAVDICPSATPAMLEKWSDPDGTGVPDLRGRKLATWKEPRLSPHGHITQYRVYSKSQLAEIAEVHVATHTPQARTDRQREAEKLLRDLLANGPVLAKEVFRQARLAGVTEIFLRRARTRLDVTSTLKDCDSGGQLWY